MTRVGYDLVSIQSLDSGFKLAVEQGLIPGPRLVLAIQIISPTGGIGDRVSPSGHGCCCAVFDPLLPNSVANGADAVRDVVRTMVRAGADVIKTATTGGASSRPGHGPKDAAFSLEEMQALVTESHALGRRVMCHALGGPGLRTALAAGVDSIEHGSYLDEEPEMMAQMAERGVFLVPTLAVYVYHRESPSPHVRAARGASSTHVATVSAPRVGVPIPRHDAGRPRPSEERARNRVPGGAGPRRCKARLAATQWRPCLGLDASWARWRRAAWRISSSCTATLRRRKVLLEPGRISSWQGAPSA